MISWINVLLAVFLFFIGLITFWLPIPIGAPLMLAGIILLMNNSPVARAKILTVTNQHPKLHKLLRKFSKKTQDKVN